MNGPLHRISLAHGARLGICLGLLMLSAACVGSRPGPYRSGSGQPDLHDERASLPAGPTTRRIALPGYLDEVPVRLEALSRASSIEVLVGARTTVVKPVSNGWSANGVHSASHSFDNAVGVRVDGRLHEGRIEFVHRNGTHLVLAWLPLENYVAGVVAAELSLWSSQPAELEAQAIAARTYAISTLRQRENDRADPRRVYLWDGVEDQAYRGRFEPNESKGERDAAVRLERAITATRGLVLMRDGEPADTRFHAACGGHTADLESVFPKSRQTAPGVPCAACSVRAQDEVKGGGPDADRPLAWRWTASEADLTKLARQHGLGQRLTRLRPTKRDVGGRWLEIELEGPRGVEQVPFNDVRRALGFMNLRSTRILSTWPRQGEAITGGLAFVGLGYGHGVGLCQEGTRDQARSGSSSRAILQTYYPDATLQQLEARGRTLPRR